MRRSLVSAPLVIALVATAAPALAQLRRVESRRSDVDPAALDRLLVRGPIALVESLSNGRSKQCVVFATVNASPEQVWDTLWAVEDYPKFMRSVERMKIVRSQGGLQMFDWELNVPVFNLRGRRMMRGKRPFALELRGVSGHFRDAHEAWELYPLDGGTRTLIALYRTVDVANGGVLLKTMVELEASMEHGINASVSFVQIRDLSRHLEGLPPARPGHHTGPLPEFRPLLADATELTALRGLLQHGELAMIESHEDGSLRQVTVLASVAAGPGKLTAVAHRPDTWPSFVPNLVSQKVTEESKGVLRLEYEIEVPLANVEGVNRMTIHEDGSVDMVAVSGDVSRGKWRWEFRALPDGVTVPVHYAYTDVRDASWFVKKLVEQQPLFEHGVVATASTIAVRALKARALGQR